MPMKEYEEYRSRYGGLQEQQQKQMKNANLIGMVATLLGGISGKGGAQMVAGQAQQGMDRLQSQQDMADRDMKEEFFEKMAVREHDTKMRGLDFNFEQAKKKAELDTLTRKGDIEKSKALLDSYTKMYTSGMFDLGETGKPKGVSPGQAKKTEKIIEKTPLTGAEIREIHGIKTPEEEMGVRYDELKIENEGYRRDKAKNEVAMLTSPEEADAFDLWAAGQAGKDETLAKYPALAIPIEKHEDYRRGIEWDEKKDRASVAGMYGRGQRKESEVGLDYFTRLLKGEKIGITEKTQMRNDGAMSAINSPANFAYDLSEYYNEVSEKMPDKAKARNFIERNYLEGVFAAVQDKLTINSTNLKSMVDSNFDAYRSDKQYNKLQDSEIRSLIMDNLEEQGYIKKNKRGMYQYPDPISELYYSDRKAFWDTVEGKPQQEQPKEPPYSKENIEAASIVMMKEGAVPTEEELGWLSYYGWDSWEAFMSEHGEKKEPPYYKTLEEAQADTSNRVY